MELTAYIGDDGAIYFRARPEFLDGQNGRPLGESFDRVGPGESWLGGPSRNGINSSKSETGRRRSG
jgi:hypothetical protein